MKNTLHVPLLAHRNKKINGCEVVDGAYCFSGTDLPHGDDSLYVGDSPYAEVSMVMSAKQIMYPSLGENDCDYNYMIQTGYDAFMKWDGKMKKKVGLRKAHYPTQAILWVLKLFELLISFLKWLFLFGTAEEIN